MTISSDGLNNSGAVYAAAAEAISYGSGQRVQGATVAEQMRQRQPASLAALATAGPLFYKGFRVGGEGICTLGEDEKSTAASPAL